MSLVVLAIRLALFFIVTQTHTHTHTHAHTRTHARTHTHTHTHQDCILLRFSPKVIVFLQTHQNRHGNVLEKKGRTRTGSQRLQSGKMKLCDSQFSKRKNMRSLSALEVGIVRFILNKVDMEYMYISKKKKRKEKNLSTYSSSNGVILFTNSGLKVSYSVL